MSILFIALQAALIFSSQDDISKAVDFANTKIGGEAVSVDTEAQVFQVGVSSNAEVERNSQSEKEADSDSDKKQQQDSADESEPEEEAEKANNSYYLHKDIITTFFWVGEGESEDNGGISNVPSAWDENWAKHFGGEDDPKKRNGYFPAKFTPQENPFYFALPYNDFNDEGQRRPDVKKIIPWANVKNWKDSESMCKNQWIRIVKNGKAAYAQWEDVGPFEEKDASYVFGTAKPKNKDHSKAGLDVSPAVKDYLRLSDVDKVDWQFVDESSVPDGPWKKIITRSQIYWK